MISKAFPGKNGEILERVRRLDELHAPKDSNGIPLWYMPRSWGEVQKEMAKLLASVAENQRRTTEIIERIDERIKE